MAFYSLTLDLNMRNIMYYTVYAYGDKFPNNVVAKILYEDTNRLDTWEDFKKVLEPFGYTEEGYEEDPRKLFIKITVFFTRKEYMKDEEINEEIYILAENMVHHRNVATLVEMVLKEDDYEPANEPDDYVWDEETEDEDYEEIEEEFDAEKHDKEFNDFIAKVTKEEFEEIKDYIINKKNLDIDFYKLDYRHLIQE
ncbi:hypothetical protein [Miniphocaeibacter massiliensis]|uniref:hypothetical protein n=1 Tax=Miniphocaeibacter massiliensis TaxID=2041841 RepID=UPI000C083DDE|nr:hypothetical protein [Miniphocaeibacter massiliensis]